MANGSRLAQLAAGIEDKQKWVFFTMYFLLLFNWICTVCGPWILYLLLRLVAKRMVYFGSSPNLLFNFWLFTYIKHVRPVQKLLKLAFLRQLFNHGKNNHTIFKYIVDIFNPFLDIVIEKKYYKRDRYENQ